MTDPATELSFDRATYATGAGGAAACSGCKRPLDGQYWKWQRLVLCASCRDGLEKTLAATQSSKAFGKALVQGTGAALVCGAAYAVFVALSNIQFALATIGIAIVVAQVIRKASGGVSGRRFQILAVILTYCGSAMGYAPPIYNAIEGALKGQPFGPMAAWYLIRFSFTAPFEELKESNVLGLLVIGIGLWSAWRRTYPVPLTIEGPFRVALVDAPPANQSPQVPAPPAPAPPVLPPSA
jgi:hypothetical protein